MNYELKNSTGFSQKPIEFFPKIGIKNLLKDLWFAEGFHYQAHLGGRERAATARVAMFGQALFQSGETAYPLTQFAPGGSRSDVGTVELCQLRAAIFPDAESFHATKVMFFHRIDEGFTANNRQQLTKTDHSPPEPARR